MLGFAVSGLAAALLSGAAALILAALYSLISFGTTFIAGRVVQSVRRGADERNPLGRGGRESLYVLFRSLILIGIIGAAVVEAAITIIEYVTTGEGTIPDFAIVATYCLLAGTGSLVLSAYHRRNLARVGGRSSILSVEATAARNDGLIDASIGIALGLVLLIPQGTVLTSDSFNIDYIADSIIVVILGTALLGGPIALVREQVRRLSGERVDTELESEIRASVEALIDEHAPGQFTVIDVYAVVYGGARSAGLCVTFPGAATLEQLDELRSLARSALGERYPGMSVSIDFTALPLHRQVT